MKEFICIQCPKGCHLTVDDNLEVKGNACIRGEMYGKAEATHPVRSISSTVRIESKLINRCPVKTSVDIPKDMIFEVMNEINKVNIKAPIHIGDVIIENVLNTGSNIVSCRNIEE